VVAYHETATSTAHGMTALVRQATASHRSHRSRRWTLQPTFRDLSKLTSSSQYLAPHRETCEE
jgi:hypothetical protein